MFFRENNSIHREVHTKLLLSTKNIYTTYMQHVDITETAYMKDRKRDIIYAILFSRVRGILVDAGVGEIFDHIHTISLVSPILRIHTGSSIMNHQISLYIVPKISEIHTAVKQVGYVGKIEKVLFR
jgi:hypothetical protein